MTIPEANEALLEAREAVQRHSWHQAHELFGAAASSASLEPPDLEAMAEASWWIGKIDDAIGARERAYSAYVAAEETAKAARVAIEIAYDHLNRGTGALGTGWVRRAEQLLTGKPETSAHGYLARIKAVIAFERDASYQEALTLAEEACRIGALTGDRDLEALGLHDQGRVMVAMGKVEEGMSLMDSAMVAAVGGELGPMATGKIYCNMISICEKLADYGRAGDWTEAASRWCDREGHESGFPGLCRVHKAEIMRLRGAWAEAEQEARRACGELQDFVSYTGEAFYEIGEVRFRMGDLSGAEEAFRQAHEFGRSPVPGLAHLRMEQGRPEAAMALLDEALAQSSPGPLDRARLLPAHAEVALELGDLKSAGSSAEEMERIAAEYGTAALRAAASQARGQVHLASGNPEAAIPTIREAQSLWQEVDLPYEAAKSRFLLGVAFRAAGNQELADLELGAARSAFQRLGARRDAVRTGRLLGTDQPIDKRDRTLMFTDIVGSTQLIEVIGDEAWSHLVRWHDETLRTLFGSHGGTEIDHAGDGFFVSFEDPTVAVECALAIQRILESHRREHGFAPVVRIGLHQDLVGSSHTGRAVHQAARMAGVAAGEEILATRSTAEAAGARASEPRLVRLKGLAEPIEVVAIEWR